MLDFKSGEVLSAIKKLSPRGGYIVSSAEEIASFAGLNELTGEELGQALAGLSAWGYINLRFFEDGEFCCSVLQKGIDYEPVVVGKTGFFARNKALIAFFLAALIASFVGSFIGGLLFYA